MEEVESAVGQTDHLPTLFHQSLQTHKSNTHALPHPSLCLVFVVAHLSQDDKTSLVKQHRQKELDMRRKTYRQVHSTHAVCDYM